MDFQNQHSDMRYLSTQQHVSLDKHQNMVNSTLKWQKHAQPAQETNQQQTAPVTRISLAFATILNIFIK